MKTPSGHLTYCTNIHAGESWPDHFAAIKQNFPSIKKIMLWDWVCVFLMKQVKN